MNPLTTLIENYNPIGDMMAIVCCMLLLIIIVSVAYFSSAKGFGYLKKAVHFTMIGAFFNICFYNCCVMGVENEYVIYGLRIVYHFCLMCTLYLFILYMKDMLAVRGTLVTFVSHLTRVYFLASIILDSLSAFTGIGLHKEGEEWLDPLKSFYNAFYLYALILFVVMLLGYTERLIKTVQRVLIATECIVALIMTAGGVLNTNTMTSFTYVLPIMVMMVLLHSQPFDDKTGALSGESFSSYIQAALKNKTAVDYMVLKFNMNLSNKIPDELAKILNNFWHSTFKNATLFRIEHDVYVLGVPRTEKNGNTEEKIRYLLDDEFHRYYAKYQIQYKVIGLFDMDFIQSEVDFRGMIEYLLITMKENSVVVADDRVREQLRMVREIRENLKDIEIKNDLEDERVLAYCQPIKNMSTGKYDTAEALMRMQIPGMGMVFPNLFIPLAEHYGHIHALTRIILNKVCKEIRQLEEEGYEFKRISINFAASEIRADDFCDEILNIIRENGVNPSKVGIELTESQNESDFMIVKQKMNILREAGMTLYLDDVGTGYSNLDRIVRYEVDVVKFDRFFLLEAEKSNNVEHMMRHLADAFKDLEYDLLYEGVETESNEELCLRCGADYIQGFKYSKPIPVEQVRDFFEKAS